MAVGLDRKLQGLLCKISRRRSTVRSVLLDLKWTVQIKNEEGEGNDWQLEQCRHGGSSIDSGEKLAGVHG